MLAKNSASPTAARVNIPPLYLAMGPYGLGGSTAMRGWSIWRQFSAPHATVFPCHKKTTTTTPKEQVHPACCMAASRRQRVNGSGLRVTNALDVLQVKCLRWHRGKTHYSRIEVLCTRYMILPVRCTCFDPVSRRRRSFDFCRGQRALGTTALCWITGKTLE